MDVIQASVPLFFLLIGVELLVAKLRGQKLYRLNDSVADLSCGTASQLVGVFVTLLTVALYGFFRDRFSIQTLLGAPPWPDRSPFPGGALDLAALGGWAAAFVLDDLAYYWVHRCSHEVNILWAGHVVHHSSEEYNLTVALRQSSLHGLLSWVFYLPLAIVGIPVSVWVVCHAINLIYQFWIHTREIDRLGPLEAVMNTPSHHRVHHGVNPQYQDRNYAGVFIIWDRIFGTFEPEVEEPVYGITKPLASWNPIWANLHILRDIGRNFRLASRWPDKLRIVFGRPGWRPAELGPSEKPKPVSAAAYHKYDPPVARSLKVYATAQFAVVVVAATVLLAKTSVLPWLQVLAGVFYLVLAMSNIGAIFEGRSWAAVSEVARLVVLAGAAAVLALSGRGQVLPLAAAILFAIGSAGWMLWLRPAFGPPARA